MDNAGFEATEVPIRGQYSVEEQSSIDDRSSTTITKDAAGVSSAAGDTVDQLQRQLGGYGRYQVVIYILIGLVYMRGGWNVWVPGLQAFDPGHHCAPQPGLFLNQSVPGTEVNGVWTWDACDQFKNITEGNDTAPCANGWLYTWEDFGGSSVVSEFDLVCDRGYLVTLTSTIYMVGTTCGVVLLTPLSDRYGAKTVMLVCLWLQAIVGTVLIWSDDILVYAVLKFFIGLFNMTIALCAYVLMVETFDSSHREMPTIFMQFFWALGIMSLALFGYLLPDWKHLQLLIALPINLISVTFVWIIPESLPWLLSKHYTREAKDVVKTFINVNKLPEIENLDKMLEPFLETRESTDIHSHEDDLQKSVTSSKTGVKKETKRLYTTLDLFKTPRLRIYTFIMFYVFLANALAYIGIMYTSPNLNGNRFLNLFLLGVVEIPAYITCYILNKYIGRRRSICGFMFVCGMANMAALLVPQTSDELESLQITLVMIGKFSITGSYSTIYLYAAEVFPTVVRNQAVGASSFFENVGSMAAPSMVLVNDQVNNLPLGVFGGMAIVGAILVLFLPETHNLPLSQTIQDIECKPHRRENAVGPDL